MTKGVAFMDSTETVSKAAKMMKEYKIGSIIIMENFVVVGILTERDLVRRVLAMDRPASTKVKEIMSSPLIVIGPDESISELAQLMIDRKIHRVPVLKPPEKQESRLVGIVTATDLIHFASKDSASKMTKIINQIYLRKND
jgi:CBS domain-containing protein